MSAVGYRYIKHQEVMRGRDAKGRLIGDRQYRGVFGMSPMSFDRGAGLRDIENRLSDQLEFDEVLTGRFAPTATPGSRILEAHYEDFTLSLIPLGLIQTGSPVVTYLGGSSKLLYRNAYPHADLQFMLAGHVIHKEILLKVGHANTYKFLLEGIQGKYSIDHGRVIFEGTNIQLAPPTLRWDPRFPTQLSPIGNSEAGTFELQLGWDIVQKAEGIELTIVLPPYPNGPGDWAGWVLDPTLTLQEDDSAMLDTYVNQDGATTNYGTNTLIKVHNISPWRRRSFLNFSVSDTIPATSICDDADYSTWSNGNAGNPSVSLTKITSGWNEGTMTWNSGQPSASGSIGPTVTRAGGPTTSDMTDSVIDDWWNDANEYGLRMLTGSSTWNYMRSSSYGTSTNRPKIVILYTPPSTGFVVRSSFFFSLAGLAIPAALGKIAIPTVAEVAKLIT